MLSLSPGIDITATEDDGAGGPNAAGGDRDSTDRNRNEVDVKWK